MRIRQRGICCICVLITLVDKLTNVRKIKEVLIELVSECLLTGYTSTFRTQCTMFICTFIPWGNPLPLGLHLCATVLYMISTTSAKHFYAHWFSSARAPQYM